MSKLRLDIAYDQTVGMRGQQQLHDSKARFGAHGGKHVSVLCHLLRAFLRGCCWHISILAEISNPVNQNFA